MIGHTDTETIALTPHTKVNILYSGLPGAFSHYQRVDHITPM